MKIVPTAKGVKAALLTGAALALSIPFTTAQAQEEQLEEITVTGSRIARDEFSSSSPIAVVTGEEVALSGVSAIVIDPTSSRDSIGSRALQRPFTTSNSWRREVSV